MNRFERLKKKSQSMRKKKLSFLTLSSSLILLLVVGVTLSYLIATTGTVRNIFKPSEVTVEVHEDFSDGVNKKNVNVKNTGTTDAYLRVKLISYRVKPVEENGKTSYQRIGGETEIPTFALGEGWFAQDGFYYYTNPVAPGNLPDHNLIGDPGISLINYDEEFPEDPDGGRQVIEVMGEGVQSQPSRAVKEAWSMDTDGNKLVNKKEGE